jgi:hypothetical protein
VKSAAWLEDEEGRPAFLAEFAGYAENLPLAIAPFAAGVDEEEAQRASTRRVRITAGIFTRSS